MNQTAPKPKTIHTLSARLPLDLYNAIAEEALATGETLNGLFIKYLRIGMERNADREQAVRDFIFSIVTEERMKELLRGNQAPVTT